MSVTSSIRSTNADRETTSADRLNRNASRRLTTRPNQNVQQSETSHVNVGDMERVISAVSGGTLAIYGLSRGTIGGLFLAGVGGALAYRGLSGHCSIYCALGLSTAEDHGPMTSIPAGSGTKIEHTTTINRPADDLYLFWSHFENLPNFMRHLKSVNRIDGRRSHWVAKAPLGMSVEWDAEVHTARPNELISWRSLPGSQVDTAGSVHFTPVQSGRATAVRVVMKYDAPAGKAGAAIANWFGEAPEQQIVEDLKEFKRLMEAGQSGSNPATR
jgi:uncharacterized membrane protein